MCAVEFKQIARVLIRMSLAGNRSVFIHQLARVSCTMMGNFCSAWLVACHSMNPLLVLLLLLHGTFS